MKLHKMKVARLSDDQAKSLNGGGTIDSSRKNFTCCWCTSGNDDSVTRASSCCTTDPSLTQPDPGTISPTKNY